MFSAVLRKKLDADMNDKKVEQENDLLVCGDCQTNFPLQDIVKFIRHKINKCSKELTDSLDSPDVDDGNQSDSETLRSSISSKRTSISAPIALKELVENKTSPRPSLESLSSLKDVRLKEENCDTLDEDTKISESKILRSPLKPKQVVDAESNTTYTVNLIAMYLKDT
ncbi:hypothetical protein KUTeg_012873 [Tegillarca granosa]|uniref:BCL-11A-like CCHC zinc finger domain-containing protein n=1 Tax=Tegillarca granosa TaxID=220873 RepID=A0ABQ9ES08_TEGGR|nr:hypothetical protein KUTeg_012873 [Tegillarca granosa]